MENKKDIEIKKWELPKELEINNKTEGIAEEKGKGKIKNYIFNGDLRNKGNININLDGNLKVSGVIDSSEGDVSFNDLDYSGKELKTLESRRGIYAKEGIYIKGNFKHSPTPDFGTTGINSASNSVFIEGNCEARSIKAAHIIEIKGSVKWPKEMDERDGFTHVSITAPIVVINSLETDHKQIKGEIVEIQSDHLFFTAENISQETSEIWRSYAEKNDLSQPPQDPGWK